MSGLIATPCRPDHARHVAFYRSLLALATPEGTRADLFPGFFSHYNKNAAVEQALAEQRPWIFFVDDDQVLRPDALKALLARDVDIVVCNLLTKDPPFQPYLFFATDHTGAGYADTLEARRGLIEVAACGAGGLLVKTDVFRRLPPPWFAVNEQLHTDDLYFCHEAQKAGYRIWCDLDVISEHIRTVSIRPAWDEEQQKWRTEIVFDDKAAFAIPAAAQTPEYRAWKEEQLKAREAVKA